jgi:Ankyrin repeats (many copies)
MNQPSQSSQHAECEVPATLLRLREHWWCALDDIGHHVPLVAVNQVNALGEAPIHIAAWKGSPADVTWLIENGADISRRGDFGMTPLHYAYMGQQQENTKVLLEAGADPEARCDRGLRPADGREP